MHLPRFVDSITYTTLTLAILRAGHVAFPLSTRNSASAVAHLVRTTGLSALFVSRDAGMGRLVEEALEILKKDEKKDQ